MWTSSTSFSSTFQAGKRASISSIATRASRRARWLKLAGTTELCRFENGKPGAMTSTRLYVDLDTLYSTTPTFAGVAYLAKIAPPKDTPPSANPASAHCSALFGASQFGWSDKGGGWVTDDRPNEVFNLCVFADMSFVDEFAIWYYTHGIVRGRDLAKVMRYRPAQLPNFFPH